MTTEHSSEEGGEGLNGWRGANLLAEWVESLWTTSCGHGGGYARDCTRCIHETLHASDWLREYVADRLAEAHAEGFESYNHGHADGLAEGQAERDDLQGRLAAAEALAAEWESEEVPWLPGPIEAAALRAALDGTR